MKDMWFHKALLFIIYMNNIYLHWLYSRLMYFVGDLAMYLGVVNLAILGAQIIMTQVG